MSEDSVLHGLNIDEDVIHNDLHRSSGAASSVNRDLELAMWTNLHFPEEPIFSPERDQASKSRHKLVDSPPNGGVSNTDPVGNGFNFFGSVGASLLPETGRSKASGSNQHHASAMAGTSNGSLHDLFSWGMFDPSAHHALFGNRTDVNVDPFLSNGSTSAVNTNSNEGASGSASAHEVSPYTMATSGLPPLTIKDPRDLKAKQAALMAQNPRAIDPANTTIAPPPAKRARLPSLTTTTNNSANMIPVSYNHAPTPTLHTGLSAEDAGLDDDDMETSPLHAHVHGHSLSLDGQLGLDKSNMNPAEDKRRRNTLASARFRAKKKEREAAMERKARELDEKVAELERECEVLRKENNWLKGLVVGASTTTPPNGATTAVTEEPALPTTTVNKESQPSSTIVSPPNGVVEAAKGSVIDVDELLRVLKASGAVLTGSAVTANGDAPTQKQGPTPATGKRKRSTAAANN